MAYMISVKEIPVSQTKERVTPLYLTAFFSIWRIIVQRK